MRIHWAIVTFAVIGTILITWHLRTRHLDFMAPSGVDLPPLETPYSGNPTFIHSHQDGIPLDGPHDTPEPAPISPPLELADITEAELGDLFASPGLDTYRNFARNHPPERILLLADKLEEKAEFQHTFLALERIIDTSDPTPASATLKEATSKIAELASTLQPWNIDPSAKTILTLNLESEYNIPPEFKRAALELANLIHETSGEQLEIIPRINIASKEPPSADTLIFISLSGSEENQKSTPSFTIPQNKDLPTQIAINSLAEAIYLAIQKTLPNYPQRKLKNLETTGSDLIRLHLTRLIWRDLSDILSQPKEELIEEDDESQDEPE